MSFKVKEQIEEIKQLVYEKGEYNKAQKALNAIERNKEITDEESLSCSILRCQILTKQGEFSKSLDLANELIKKALELNNDLVLLDALIEKMESLWRIGDHQSQMEVIIKAEMIFEKIPNKNESNIQEKIGLVKTWKSAYYWSLADFNQAISVAQISLKFLNKSRRKIHITNTNFLIGTLYSDKGDKDIAISFLKQCLKDYEEFGNKRQIALALHNLAGLYTARGNYRQGLLLSKKSLKLREQIGNKQDIAITLSLVANIETTLGEYSQALNNLKRAIDLLEDSNDTKYIPGYLRLIGNVNYNLGNKELALENLQRSLELATQREDRFLTAFILYDLTIKNLDYGKEKQAKSYFDLLHKINSQIIHYKIDNLYHICKALILKTEDDARSRGKAEGILEYLISSQRIDFNERIQALINLCDLLLVDLYNTGKEEILEDLSEKIDYLIEITKSNQANVLLIEGYRLKSLLNLTKLDVNKSIKILEEAHTLAKDRKLEKIIADIQSDLKQISDKKPLWEKLKKDQKSLVEILKQTPLMNGMKRVAREIILNVEEREITESFEHRKLFTLKI